MEGTGHHLRLLGPTRFTAPGGAPVDLAPGKPLALLLYLHLADGPVSREDLGTLLWPETTRDRARGSVRHALWLLRRTLGDDLFLGEDPVEVASGALTSDVEEFRGCLVSDDLERARELWKGPPFEDFRIPDAPEWTRWTEDLRRELEERHATALSARGRRDWERGRPEEAVPWLREAASLQPHRLQHHLDLAEALLDLRRFDAVGGAISEARRHCDAPAHRRALQELEERLQTVQRGSAPTPHPEDPLRFAFVGRTEEFTAFLKQWRQARGGATRVGLLTGDPGIGKTRLAEEVGLVVSAEGGRTVHVKAEDSERPIEWALMAELVERLLKLSGAAGVSRAADQVLRTLLPSLALPDPADGEGPRRPPGRGGGTRPSAALSDALADLIHAVAEDGPLLVVLDDLQWADPESRAVLARVATHMKKAPAFLLFTCRSEVEDPRVRKTLALLAEAPGALSRELAPWTRENLAELLQSLVIFPSPAEAERVIRRIHRASRGNPLFVLELMKVLQEEGVLEERGDGRWILLPHRLPPDLPLPESVRGLVDRQLEQLSDEATMVAAHLARIGHAASVRTLALRTGLGSSQVTHGVGELLQRRMIRWEDGENLGFAHDEIRATVARRFQLQAEPARAEGGPWPPSPAVLTGTTVVLLLVALGLLFQRPFASATLPFGGGEIVLRTGGALQALELRSASPEGLQVGSRSAGGAGGSASAQDGPPMPDTDPGRRPGWTVDLRPAASGGGTDLVVGRWRRPWEPGGSPNGGVGGEMMEERTVLHSPTGLHLARLSPSQEWVAVARSGRPDSLLILSPGGRRVAALAVPSVVDATWCGDGRLTLLVREEGELGLRSWDPWEGEVREMDTGGVLPGGGLACSPDGTALLFLGASQGRPGLHLLVPGRGTTPLQLPDEGDASPLAPPEVVGWFPPRPPDIAEELRIVGPRVQAVPWGEPQKLEAILVRSGGSDAPVTPEWSVRGAPGVRLSPEGALVGLQGGSGWVLAEWEGWLRDSIRVEIQGTGHPALRFRDRFSDPLLPEWEGTGWTAVEGTLHLNGSPHATLLSHTAVELPEGGTLEFEFRLPVDRRAGQGLRVCLEAVPGSGPGGGPGGHPSACLVYPAATDGRWDPREVELRSGPAFPGTVEAVPRLLPPRDWVPMALRIAPQGEVSAFVGWRQARLDAAVRDLPPRESRWRIRIEGWAEDTELEIRNLHLWSGRGTHP